MLLRNLKQAIHGRGALATEGIFNGRVRTKRLEDALTKHLREIISRAQGVLFPLKKIVHTYIAFIVDIK